MLLSIEGYFKVAVPFIYKEKFQIYLLTICTKHCSTGDKHPKMNVIDVRVHKHLYITQTNVICFKDLILKALNHTEVCPDRPLYIVTSVTLYAILWLPCMQSDHVSHVVANTWLRGSHEIFSHIAKLECKTTTGCSQDRVLYHN